MLLKLSLIFFLVGLTIHIWHVAAVPGKWWETDDLKVSDELSVLVFGAVLTKIQIAVFVTIAAAAALLLYIIAVIGLFYRGVDREKEES